MMNAPINVPSIPKLSLRPSFRRRWLRRLALTATIVSVLVLLTYGVVVLVMLGIEPSLVYYPTRPHQEWTDKPAPAIEDVYLTTADGKLHGWYMPGSDPDCALLICHGTGGNLSIRGQGLPEYSRRYHASVLVFDYPGYGHSEGEPTEAGCYAAAEAYYEWLRQKGFPPERIVIYGESLGGGVAVDLASRKGHGALLLVNTFANLPEVAQRIYWYLPVTLLMNNRFDSESKIAKVKGPIFITHGMADRLIPLEHSKRLFERANGQKVQLLRPGKDHEDPLGPDTLDQIRDFLATAGCIKKK